MAGIITALRFQKRDANRVNIYLDDQFAFGLSALAAASLKRGLYLSDDEIAQLQAEDERQKAYQRSLRFLAYRPRTIAEVRKNLRKHDVSDSAIESVIERLLEAGYLNDMEFARFWVNDRERFRPKGPLALRAELRQKGVANDIIDQVIESIDMTDGAYRAGLARAQRLVNVDQQDFRKKLASHLLRRGFTHDVVWPTVERLCQERHQPPDD
ncbi:MAG: RecX family transcriptional regulator [Chloroflexota bacterium]|nr:RecX family transcriptional regulator [Chloroflexota bacterium]